MPKQEKGRAAIAKEDVSCLLRHILTGSLLLLLVGVILFSALFAIMYFM